MYLSLCEHFVRTVYLYVLRLVLYLPNMFRAQQNSAAKTTIRVQSVSHFATKIISKSLMFVLKPNLLYIFKVYVGHMAFLPTQPAHTEILRLCFVFNIQGAVASKWLGTNGSLYIW